MSCPECFRGSIHTHTTPTGTLSTLHGVSTYITAADPRRSHSTIILFTDAFGLKLPNSKLLADKYALLTGCRVLVPDFVYGGGFPVATMQKVEAVVTPLDQGAPWSERIAAALYRVWAVLSLLPWTVPFMIYGHPKNSYGEILAYARAVKAELVSDSGGGGKLGAAGFCWGAWVATKLCTEPSTESPEDDVGKPLLEAQFNGHPSYMTDSAGEQLVVDAIKTFRVPYAVAVAEKDVQFDKTVAEWTEARVRRELGETGSNGCAYEFRIYRDCTHGFCVKAKEGSVNMAGSEEALKQAVSWFKKYLN